MFFQIAAALGLSDDPRLRQALQDDEENIAATLDRVSRSGAHWQAALALSTLTHSAYESQADSLARNRRHAEQNF